MKLLSFLLFQNLLPALHAQAIRRLASPHPGLGRRVVGNCTPSDTNCEFCAAAFILEWQSIPIDPNLYKTMTLQEVVNEDGSTDLETITSDWDTDAITQWSSSQSLVSQGVHTTSIDGLDIVM